MEGEIERFLESASSLLDRSGVFPSETGILRELAVSVRQPFRLAVVGRMKAGKSTLINGLIGRDLAISDVEEATATLNWIRHGQPEQEDCFEVHWQDGSVETLPLGWRKQWAGKSPEVLDRVRRTRFLHLFAHTERLREVEIIDTPGTGSAVEEHEIAKDFLDPETLARSMEEGGKADAILYVVPQHGREQDEETLKTFAKSRLPGSDPYNSVAVLHKWDGLQADDPFASAHEKADRLREQFGGMVADAIPVSGPLALAARTAPDAFFSGLVELLRKEGGGLDRPLRSVERWNADPARRSVRTMHAMPWVSFKLLLRILREESIDDPEEARRRCLEKSGVPELEAALKDRFFSRQAIIKQCQLLNRTGSVLDRALLKLNRATDGTKGAGPSGITLAEVIACDRQWQGLRGNSEGLEMDLKVTDALRERPDLFPESHRETLRAICNHLAILRGRSDLGTGRIPSLHEIDGLIREYRKRANLAERGDSPLLAHVAGRLEEIHALVEDNLMGVSMGSPPVKESVEKKVTEPVFQEKTESGDASSILEPGTAPPPGDGVHSQTTGNPLRPHFERDSNDGHLFLKEVLIVLWRSNPAGIAAHLCRQLIENINDATPPDQKAAMLAETLESIEIVPVETFENDFSSAIGESCGGISGELIKGAVKVYPQIEGLLRSAIGDEDAAITQSFTRLTLSALVKQRSHYQRLENFYNQLQEFLPRYTSVMTRSGFMDGVIGFAAGLFGGYLGVAGAHAWGNWRDSGDKEFCQKFGSAFEEFAQSCYAYTSNGEDSLSLVFDRLIDESRRIESRVFDCYDELARSGLDIEPLYRQYRTPDEPLDDDTEYLFEVAISNLEENRSVHYRSIENIRQIVGLSGLST